jgi:hypothetical protein
LPFGVTPHNYVHSKKAFSYFSLTPLSGLLFHETNYDDWKGIMIFGPTGIFRPVSGELLFCCQQQHGSSSSFENKTENPSSTYPRALYYYALQITFRLSPVQIVNFLCPIDEISVIRASIEHKKLTI